MGVNTRLYRQKLFRFAEPAWMAAERELQRHLKGENQAMNAMIVTLPKCRQCGEISFTLSRERKNERIIHRAACVRCGAGRQISRSDADEAIFRHEEQRRRRLARGQDAAYQDLMTPTDVGPGSNMDGLDHGGPN